MFIIFLLLNINFTILRSIRNTLAVVDLGSGAHSIPFYELFGAMPGAWLMTWGLVCLLNRFSIEKVFLVTITAFIGFFLVFNQFIYPHLSHLKTWGGNWTLILDFISMLFYVTTELWKPALGMILLWGLVNQYLPIEEAKRLYAPLMLGGSLGAIIAGPLISLCTAQDKWASSLNLMIGLVSLLGMITAFLYYLLWKNLSLTTKTGSDRAVTTFSLKDSIHLCMQNRPLRLLSWIVIADYISYSLGEVIFLEMLKMQYPEPTQYCHYMGLLSSWCGVLTLISSILITPYLLKNYSWTLAFLITPVCLLATEGAFFIFLRGHSLKNVWFGWSEAEWLGMVILLGSIQYCVCRAAKYTLFDASKELAFILMPESQRMRGKLVVDGLCARMGRGSASMISIGLITMGGGVVASSLFAGLIAIGMGVSWVISAVNIGKLIDQPKKPVKGT
jgi:AAA family ATP:ADP antiporter